MFVNKFHVLLALLLSSEYVYKKYILRENRVSNREIIIFLLNIPIYYYLPIIDNFFRWVFTR